MKNRYVLFSPIGTTDPISNYRDGAMLHITRKYMPEKVYLYLSKEMCVLNNTDDRYRQALRLLGEENDVAFDIEIIEKPNLTQVHLFDAFYDEFEELIKDILAQYSEHIILLNVSSGTPAMKGALQTLAALSDNNRILPIQVPTPEKGANPRRDDIHTYSLEAEWKCDEDNDTNKYIDRTQISTSLNLNARLKKEIITKSVNVYDYHSALAIAKEIKRYMPHEAFKLLEAANSRIQLDIEGAMKDAAGTSCEIAAIKDKHLQNISEYFLWLEIKLRREEYPDFLRGLTPLIADLFEIYISKKLSIDLWKYCSYSDKRNNRMIMRKQFLMQDEIGQRILEALDTDYNGYRETVCSSGYHLAIIKTFTKDKDADVLEIALKLRQVEELCRNIVAHEIVSVTKEWIFDKLKYWPKEILTQLLNMADKADIPTVKLKDSYGKMNAQISSELGIKQELRKGA